MSFLFFLMAFVNTIIDSLKDSLVITAAGGGTEASRAGALRNVLLLLSVQPAPEIRQQERWPGRCSPRRCSHAVCWCDSRPAALTS